MDLKQSQNWWLMIEESIRQIYLYSFNSMRTGRNQFPLLTIQAHQSEGSSEMNAPCLSVGHVVTWDCVNSFHLFRFTRKYQEKSEPRKSLSQGNIRKSLCSHGTGEHLMKIPWTKQISCWPYWQGSFIVIVLLTNTSSIIESYIKQKAQQILKTKLDKFFFPGNS